MRGQEWTFCDNTAIPPSSLNFSELRAKLSSKHFPNDLSDDSSGRSPQILLKQLGPLPSLVTGFVAHLWESPLPRCPFVKRARGQARAPRSVQVRESSACRVWCGRGCPWRARGKESGPGGSQSLSWPAPGGAGMGVEGPEMAFPICIVGTDQRCEHHALLLPQSLSSVPGIQLESVNTFHWYWIQGKTSHVKFDSNSINLFSFLWKYIKGIILNSWIVLYAMKLIFYFQE